MSCGWITAASISFPPSLSLFSPLLNLPSTRGEPIPVGQGRAGEPDYAAVPYGCSQTLYFQRWDRKLKPPRKPSTCGITAVRFIKLELSRSSLLCRSGTVELNTAWCSENGDRRWQELHENRLFEDFLGHGAVLLHLIFPSNVPLGSVIMHACKRGWWSQTRNACFKSDIIRQWGIWFPKYKVQTLIFQFLIKFFVIIQPRIWCTNLQNDKRVSKHLQGSAPWISICQRASFYVWVSQNQTFLTERRLMWQKLFI